MIHGLPDHVHSDNGPQFAATIFKDFAAECGFRHTTSSPHFHQANGLAERAVQTAKKLLELDDPMMGLLNYRTTPCSATGVSPAEALMSRKLKTQLPVLEKQLHPGLVNAETLKARDQEAKRSQKTAYDRRHGARNLAPLTSGTKVLTKTEGERKWVRPGVITREDPNFRTYWVATPTGKLRRNRKDLVPAAAANQSRSPTGRLEDDNSTLEPASRDHVITVTPPEPAPSPSPARCQRTLPRAPRVSVAPSDLATNRCDLADYVC